MIKKIFLKTSKKMQMLDITQSIQDFLFESKVEDGLCVVFTPHTTAGVTINENADPDVQRDMLLGLEQMIPDENYKHFEHNSPAHMLSSIVGVSKTLMVEKAKIVLGGWQAVYFCEFDGPREREVFIKVI